ncbi:MAG: ribosome silencing factor [Candidatus Izemoplasma sp.]
MNKLKVVLDALEDVNLTDIIVYDMRERSPFFEYFIISSGSSSRQLNATMSHIKDDFAKAGLDHPDVEGKDSDSWILIDAKDIVVNVFTQESRSYYNLEKMWADVPTINIEDVK